MGGFFCGDGVPRTGEVGVEACAKARAKQRVNSLAHGGYAAWEMWI